ncbi:MAG: nucleotidyltransferase domain-containing protein [Candidatus Micrarchaeia archaeon]
MLELLFGSRVRARIITMFSTAAGREFHVRKVARNLSERPSAVLIELNRLERFGFLSSRRQANLRLYSVNVKCPVYGEIRGMALKTDAFGVGLRQALSGIQGIRFAFIFGSFAAGSERASSDIDIMVIGSPNQAQVSRAVAKAEKALSRTVNYLIYPEREFLAKRNTGFLHEVILGGKIWLAGESNEFERFVER